SVIHAFVNPPKSPYGTLILGSDGSFYGTTQRGGANDFGTVFKVTEDGQTFTTLHSFNSTDGAYPLAGIVEGSDGVLYGTTQQGGANGWGVVFKVTPDGHTFTTLHSFTAAEGANPRAELVEGTDGNFYGTTQALG